MRLRGSRFQVKLKPRNFRSHGRGCEKDFHLRAVEHARHTKQKAPSLLEAFNFNWATSYSPTHLARAVPSGLKGLTTVFGMGTGGTPSLQSPKSDVEIRSL